jgi:hypothetical protein
MNTYKSCFVALATLILTTSFAASEERFRTELKADLDGDGRKETIRLIPYKVGEAELGQLVVEDPNGKAIWKAPKSKDAFSVEPYHFLGEFDRGDLEFVGDYDQDGKIDLVTTEQKSDVRPTTYRIFHWDGHKFVFDKAVMLTPEPRERGQNPFYYTFKQFDPMASVWVERIAKLDKGMFELTVSDLSRSSRGNYQHKVTWQPKYKRFYCKF